MSDVKHPRTLLISTLIGDWTEWAHYTEGSTAFLHCYGAGRVCKMEKGIDEERRHCKATENSGVKYECVSVSSRSLPNMKISRCSCEKGVDLRPEIGR